MVVRSAGFHLSGKSSGLLIINMALVSAVNVLLYLKATLRVPYSAQREKKNSARASESRLPLHRNNVFGHSVHVVDFAVDCAGDQAVVYHTCVHGSRRLARRCPKEPLSYGIKNISCLADAGHGLVTGIDNAPFIPGEQQQR